MIVDDEKPIRQWYEFILSDLMDPEIEIVASCANGEIALDVCKTSKPDVIFTDIKMPVMNGIELIQEVKSIYPEIDILILSNFDDFEYVRNGLRLGAFDYLLKAQTDDVQIKKILDELKVKKACKNTVDKRIEYDNPLVNNMVDYIHQHYKGKILLSDLAEQFNYNADYLSLIFKQSTGKNFSAFLSDFRIEKAKILLEEGDLTIKEISAFVGYSNEMYFSTAFKNNVGVSPKAYITEQYRNS